ncbi:uncharacterized protein DMENIID0001_014060 [Sergentomyia squamirostris]
MATMWKRPAEVSFPSIWLRFTRSDPQTGEDIKFWVQDLPEDRFDEAIDMMVEHFLRDEPMCKSRKCTEDPRAIEDFRGVWKKVLTDKLTLVCFREGSDEIMGLNCLKLTQQGVEDHVENYGEACSDVLETMGYLADTGDLFNRYQVDKYISGYGLIVPPKNRGLKIGVEILKARIPLGQAVGLKATSTVFSNRSSQAAATLAGFDDTFEISYAELSKKGPHMHFPVDITPTVKLMSMRLD